MSSFSAFFSTQEFRSVYECLFTHMSTAFLSGSSDLSVPQLQSLTSLLSYYDLTIRLRNSRRMPMSVSLSFESVRFFVERHKILTSVSEPNLVASLSSSLSTSSATRVFKILNQIVDLNQKSKFALSFQHILKKLGFVESSLLAHLRNALFHQETPSERNTERALRILLREIKVLFWDKNYYWLLKLTFPEDVVRAKCNKFNVVPLEKVELNDVDASSDLAMAEKELENFLTLKGTALLQKDTVAEFVKEKVKGLHRKIAVAHLTAQHLVRISAGAVISTSNDQDQVQSARLQNFSQILLYLCEIFASNKNMHRVFDDRVLRTNMEHILVMHQVLSLDVEPFVKIAEKSQGRIFKQLISSEQKANSCLSVLGKRKPTEQPGKNEMTSVSSDTRLTSTNNKGSSETSTFQPCVAIQSSKLNAQIEQFEREFGMILGSNSGNPRYRTRINSGAGEEIDCVDEEEAALLNRLLPEEPEKIGSRPASRKGSATYPQELLSSTGITSTIQTQPQSTSYSHAASKPRPLVIGKRLMQHFLRKEKEVEKTNPTNSDGNKQPTDNSPRDLAYIMAHCPNI